MIELRGLCWDHPRCTAPMLAAAAAYRELRPEVVVRWDSRPLAQFNDQPVWEVTGGYDLIFVDHPMVGAIAERSALLPLDDVLDHDQLARLAAESIGANQSCYSWNDRTWALGVDAACQVAAFREDRLAALGAEVPRTWAEVVALARRSPGFVALPLYPSDALCTLVSLSANVSGGAEWLRPEAVEFLAELAGLVDPACFGLNPPALFERMITDSPIGYLPFTFGYANLARPPLIFTDVPGVDGQPNGAILGGAGLAILPDSAHAEAAAEFAAWCMDEAVQRDVLLPAGGQPGHGSLWRGPSTGSGHEGGAGSGHDGGTGSGDDGGTGSRPTTDFFVATRRSMERAYVRPREPWWPEFHRAAGIRLVELLRTQAPATKIIDAVSELAAQGVAR